MLWITRVRTSRSSTTTTTDSLISEQVTVSRSLAQRGGDTSCAQGQVCCVDCDGHGKCGAPGLTCSATACTTVDTSTIKNKPIECAQTSCVNKACCIDCNGIGSCVSSDGVCGAEGCAEPEECGGSPCSGTCCSNCDGGKVVYWCGPEDSNCQQTTQCEPADCGALSENLCDRTPGCKPAYCPDCSSNRGYVRCLDEDEDLPVCPGNPCEGNAIARCPADPPSNGTDCTIGEHPPAPCVYERCATEGLITAECAPASGEGGFGPRWVVKAEDCSSRSCNGLTCGSGTICGVNTGGAIVAACHAHECGTGPLSCDCLPNCSDCSRTAGLFFEGDMFSCNICPTNDCP